MKIAKMISILGVGAACLTASAAKIEFGKLIKKLDPPKATKYTVEIKGDPSITKPDEKVDKGLIIVGKDGAFSVSTNTKVHATQNIPLDAKLADGQELVIKVNNVVISHEPKGWIANLVGLEGGKNSYVVALADTGLYIAQTVPKWDSLGGHMGVKYPITIQIRRLNGVLTFFVNGLKRVDVKVAKDDATTPFFAITTQKTPSWAITDISSMEIREVNNANTEKKAKPAKNN